MIADIAFDIQHRTAAPLLQRALTLLKCPVCGAEQLTLFRDESLELEILEHGVVVCDSCTTCFRYEQDVLKLVTERPEKLTLAQRTNFLRPVGRFYQSLWRSWCMTLFSGRFFSNETEARRLIGLIDWNSLPAYPVFADLGTGNGFYATSLAGHLREMHCDGLVLAVDFSPRMLQYAARRARRLGLQDRILWVLADVETCPLRSASVDRITCGGSLNEYGRPDEVLRQVRRMMPTNGQYVAMHLHRRQGMVGLLQDLVHYLSGLVFPSQAEWISLFGTAGLTIDTQQVEGAVLFTVARP